MPFEWPESLHLATKLRIASILWTLQQHGGEITDESGLATAKLNELCRNARVRALPKQSPGTYPRLLTQMCGEGDSPWTEPLIERDLRGKRTFAIRLLLEDEDLPDPDLAWTLAHMPADVAEARGLVAVPAEPVEEEAPEAIEEETPEPPESEEPVPAELVGLRAETPAALRKVLAISKLATDLMIELSEIDQRHVGQDEVLERLATVLADNQRLTETVRELRALVETKANEIDALRQSLKLTGANLERLRLAVSVNGNGRFEVDGQRELARVMQAPPTTR